MERLLSPFTERVICNSDAVRENVLAHYPIDADRVVTATVRGSQLPRSIRDEYGLEPDRSYRLATLDYVLEQWKLRGRAGIEVETGELLRNLLLRWIEERGRI